MLVQTLPRPGLHPQGYILSWTHLAGLRLRSSEPQQSRRARNPSHLWGTEMLGRVWSPWALPCSTSAPAMLRQRQPHASLLPGAQPRVPRPGSIWLPGCRAVLTVLRSPQRGPAFSWCCSPALITAPVTLRYSCFIKYQNPLPWASVKAGVTLYPW